MRKFFRNINPRRAIVDFWDVLRGPQDHRWRSILLALAVTGTIFMTMMREREVGLPAPPQVVYFPMLDPDRTDAQIAAENVKATALRDAEDKQDAADRSTIRNRYKVAGDFFGMDTNAAIKQGEAERAAARKKLEEQNAAVLKQTVGH